MPTKIVGVLEDRIRELVDEGYIATYIEKETGVSWGGIVGWCKRNDKILGFHKNPEFKAKEEKFVALIKSGSILKHACKAVNIYHNTAIEWATRNGLDSAIRTRAEASKDRQTTLEEAQALLPYGHGEISSYDKENKVYLIKREDGTVYDRILSQLFRGDPKKGNKVRLDENEVAKILLEKGYQLIPGTFRIKREPLEATHMVCGYVRHTKLDLFDKQQCPRCSNTGTSNEEREVDEWVRSLGVETQKFRFKKDCAGKGKGKEIDIYIPELRVGIEYCGLYSHGEINKIRQTENKTEEYAKKGKEYGKVPYDSARQCHKIKMDKANDLDIFLITLFSNEWKQSQDKVKAIIRAKLGKNERKIGARETEIKEIDKLIAKNFLDTYHLQGSAAMAIAFGLFVGDELVAVVTGNNHHRVNGKFVLNRLCFKANITVSGGSSKLENMLESWAKDNGHSEIMSWSDNRWSNGGVYKALGYVLVDELDPDYFYFDNKGNTFSKQSCQKEHLRKKGAIGETEWEMAKSLGYDRIFDCGKKTWIKKLT